METQTDIETIVDGPSWLADRELTNTPLPTLVEWFAHAHATFERLMSDQSRDAYEDAKREKARRHYAFEGRLTDTASKVAESAVSETMKAYDRRRKSEAEAILKVAPVLIAAAETWVENGKRLAKPAHADSRRMLEIEEKKELRLRYDNRPLRELLAFYQTTADTYFGGDAVRFIEEEYRAGWPTLKPAIDAEGASKFQAAIAAREEARVPAERRQTRDRLGELMNPTRTLLLKHVAGHFPQAVTA